MRLRVDLYLDEQIFDKINGIRKRESCDTAEAIRILIDRGFAFTLTIEAREKEVSSGSSGNGGAST